MSDDSDDLAASVWHVSFAVAFKQPGIDFKLLAISLVLLVLPLLRFAQRLPALLCAIVPFCGAHALRPPLRAPPH